MLKRLTDTVSSMTATAARKAVGYTSCEMPLPFNITPRTIRR